MKWEEKEVQKRRAIILAAQRSALWVLSWVEDMKAAFLPHSRHRLPVSHCPALQGVHD